LQHCPASVRTTRLFTVLIFEFRTSFTDADPGCGTDLVSKQELPEMTIGTDTSHLSRFGRLLGLAASLMLAGPALAQETIPLPSLTMTDQQFLTGDTASAAKVELTGTLSLPKDPAGPVPAVILLHGSGGANGFIVWNWSKILNGIGIATFEIDSYTGRGIDKVYADQSQIGALNNINDTFAGLTLLARDDRIDPERIAVMGFSRGGIGALYSAMGRFQELYGPPDVTLAAHLPFYAACNFELKDELKVGPAPIRAFHGDADDWTPVAPCKDYVEKLKAEGRDAEIFVYPGARHAFDNVAAPAYNIEDDAQTSRKCMRVERDGQLYNADTSQPFTWKDACVEKGPSAQYNGEATDAAEKEVKAFLKALFKLG
jgi:dienelactone hydrolase